MRTLLLFRGAPGSGKSTFIDENGLRPYALSADEIRMQCQSPQQTASGDVQIGTDNEKEVWSMLYKLLEIRMKKGEFTVIDATNSKTVEMNRYKSMCDQYRYRMFCLDLTDLPIEECKRRNANRIPLKRVPEDCIDKMYSRFRTQKIPSGIKVLKPEQLSEIWMKKFDMSNYEKIVHIGDIHGCYTALMEYFKDGFNDNYMYIFVGDLVDRGIENAEVVNFFIEATQRKNVLVLTGNHEQWLWLYGNDAYGNSKEFEFVTRKQLDEAKVDKRAIRQMFRRFGQCAWYQYGDKEIVVTHGGLATMPDNLTMVSTHQMIHGVGSYNDSDNIADTWMRTTKENQYQIFGHRNIKNSPIHVRDRVFNLEGKVEFGGYLRIVELDKDGFHMVAIKNDVIKPPIEQDSPVTTSEIGDIVLEMRKNKFITEKKYGNVSSFNFTNSAFYDKVWNEQTMRARGLYIDTDRMKVRARGFTKFFNINERPETKFEMLQYKLQFPVTCYVKENGFLGLVSYNPDTDDLFITTKSNPTGDFAVWLTNMVERKITEENREKMKQICKEEDVTFVFECVDMTHDPHIIKYDEDKLYLLSIVKNDIEFKQYEYDDLVNVANELGIEVKTKAFEIGSWSDFVDWYYDVLREDYEFQGRIIEGFVIEDSIGYMTKLKLTYYNFWKHLRGVAHMTLRKGYIDKTGVLTSPEANDFYGFMKGLYSTTTQEERQALPKDIISLREMFYKSKE